MDVHERWIPRVALTGAALHIAIGLADPRTRDLVAAGLFGALDGDLGRLAGAGARRMGDVGGPQEGGRKERAADDQVRAVRSSSRWR
jgi:hypothetical protein